MIRPNGIGGVVWSAILLLPILLSSPPQREAPIPTLRQAQARREPELGKWPAERVAQRMERALAKLAEYILVSPSRQDKALPQILSNQFRGTELEPKQLTRIAVDSGLRLYKGRPSRRQTISNAGFAAALHQWLGGYRVVERALFRVTQIEIGPPSSSEAKATVLYEIAGMGENRGPRQDRGVWKTKWLKDSKEVWLLAGLNSEGVSRQESGDFFFHDVTTASLGENASYHRQLSKGTGYWAKNLDAASQIDFYGLNGIAVADYDGDGWEDFYVCQPGGLPNRLFRNLGDGSFEDVTQKAGLSVLDSTSAALWADYDNDGDQDLFVITAGEILLFANNGRGRFRRSETARFVVPPEQKSGMTMAALADYDGNGFLDLYVGQYSPASGSAMTNNLYQPAPYHSANNGGANQLFRNNGDGTFANVTSSAGLMVNNRRWSLAAAWGDYNRDGYPDLYVGNDFGANNLYHNNGDGTFKDIAREAGVEDIAAGMSASWQDYDNDGRLDLYVSNIWSAAGQRIMSRPSFRPSLSEEVRRVFHQFAKGNTLFRNKGNGTFDDVTLHAGVENGGWAWGADFVDFNNDGWEDLFVLNGHITGDDRTDLESFHWARIVAESPLAFGRSKRYEEAWREFLALMSESGLSVHGGERGRFYLNTGKDRFVDISHPSGLDFADDGRAFGVIDFDLDGDLDLIVKNRTGPQIRLLRNDTRNSHHAVAFELVGRQSNRDAVGAKVFLKAGTQVRIKENKAGSGFLSQHTRRLYFGLGNQDVIAHARIEWPSGIAQEFHDVPVDSVIRIEEGNNSLVTRPFLAGTTRAVTETTNTQPADQGYRGTWLLEPVPMPKLRLLDASANPVSPLEDLRGSPVLLNLRRGDCEPCRIEQPEWEKLRQSARAPAVIAVELDKTRAARDVYFATDGATSLISSVVKHLFVRRREIGLPLTLLLDETGDIAKIYRGAIQKDWILADIRRLPHWRQQRAELALPFKGRYYGDLGSRLETYFLIATDCLKGNLEEEALQYFDQCLKIDPSLGEVLNNIGIIYARRANHEEALVNFRKAARLDPQSAQIHFNIGTSLAMVGRPKKAVAALEKAAVMDPGAPEIWTNLGNAYLDLGEATKAQSALEDALQLDPDSPWVRNSLGTIYAEQGLLDRATAHFREAVQLQPSYHAAWLNLGIIYLRQQKRDEALEMFHKVLELNPSDPDARRLVDQLQ